MNQDLNILIEKVKKKLVFEGIRLNQSRKAVRCLRQCVAPRMCVMVYKKYLQQ
jgi:hypothetical protein